MPDWSKLKMTYALQRDKLINKLYVDLVGFLVSSWNHHHYGFTAAFTYDYNVNFVASINCCSPADSNSSQKVPCQARYHWAAPRGILISICRAVFMSPSKRIP